MIAIAQTGSISGDSRWVELHSSCWSGSFWSKSWEFESSQSESFFFGTELWSMSRFQVEVTMPYHGVETYIVRTWRLALRLGRTNRCGRDLGRRHGRGHKATMNYPILLCRSQIASSVLKSQSWDSGQRFSFGADGSGHCRSFTNGTWYSYYIFYPWSIHWCGE